jgi:hypothetical protein
MNEADYSLLLCVCYTYRLEASCQSSGREQRLSLARQEELVSMALKVGLRELLAVPYERRASILL